MKKLFISFSHSEGFGNICVEVDGEKIDGMTAIKSLQEFIEMKHEITDVVIHNWRRME